jgi:hypothetical protein
MDYQIVNEYMQRKYPNRQYSIAKGNNCIWVMLNNINMYFIIRDNKIMRIDID